MKIKIVSLMFFMLFGSLLKISAQITTREKPISLELRSKTDLEELVSIELETPDLQRIAEEDKIKDVFSGAQRFAYPVLTNFNLKNSGSWIILEDGCRLWRLNLVLPGALSTHTIYNKFWLPDGAKFFVYNEKTQSFIGAVTSEFIDGTFENPESYSTGILLGENVTFEYYQPATVKEKPIIEISRIDYGYRFINHIIDAVGHSKKGDVFQNTGFDWAGWCQVNINCPEGNNWQYEKNAVARIKNVFPKGSSWVSGALVNNARNDYTSYFLTANHCLIDAYNDAFDVLGNNDLKDWIFYWSYEASGCNNPHFTNEPQHYSTRGATIIANDSPSDFALLKLKEDPRTLSNYGVTPYYLGWDATGSPGGHNGVCIHHPKGDIKKISTYGSIPISVIAHNNPNPNGNFWSVVWIETLNGRHGVTEGCSSGSPLINSNRKIIGQLFGGRSQCGDDITIGANTWGKNQPDRFGKFSVSWNANSIPQRQLKHWLAPAPSTTTVLNGIGFTNNCNLIIVSGLEPPASETYKFVICKNINVQNATVPTGKRLDLIATESITVDGITVNSGATLELNSVGSVKINSGFVIQSGASFIIR